jgi:hypothetical protein
VPELLAITGTAFSEIIDPSLTQRAGRWELLSLVRLAALVGLAMVLFLGLTRLHVSRAAGRNYAGEVGATAQVKQRSGLTSAAQKVMPQKSRSGRAAFCVLRVRALRPAALPVTLFAWVNLPHAPVRGLDARVEAKRLGAQEPDLSRQQSGCLALSKYTESPGTTAEGTFRPPFPRVRTRRLPTCDNTDTSFGGATRRSP